MAPLPDPVKSKAKDYDEKTQLELDKHIEMFLTKLVADMDEDNALRNPDVPISLHEFQKQGKNNCGYENV